MVGGERHGDVEIENGGARHVNRKEAIMWTRRHDGGGECAIRANKEHL